MKSERQERILELISKYEIETQEDMIRRLQEEGYRVTQATVSRDLRELKLTKTLTSRGTYRYAVASGRSLAGNVKLNHAMVDSITNVDYSLNLVVIKTFPGMAQAVAAAVDALSMQSILGCVAGDDTILVVTPDSDAAEAISARLKKYLSIA